jgi:hypothetical protein
VIGRTNQVIRIIGPDSSRHWSTPLWFRSLCCHEPTLTHADHSMVSSTTKVLILPDSNHVGVASLHFCSSSALLPTTAFVCANSYDKCKHVYTPFKIVLLWSAIPRLLLAAARQYSYSMYTQLLQSISCPACPHFSWDLLGCDCGGVADGFHFHWMHTYWLCSGRIAMHA